MQGLTKRQLQTLDFIRQSINQRGYPPTLREIGEHMGIRSTNGVNDHLRALERKGYLRREDMKSRALKLVESMDSGSDTHSSPPEDFDATDVVEVQVLGRVAAGLPLLAEENVIDTVRVDRGLLRGGRDVFGLRVTGDSMIEAGILSGDYIFVRKQATADRGDVVVALIGDEATVKYYYPEREYVRFQPANSRMAPILVRAMDFEINDASWESRRHLSATVIFFLVSASPERPSLMAGVLVPAYDYCPTSYPRPAILPGGLSRLRFCARFDRSGGPSLLGG